MTTAAPIYVNPSGPGFKEFLSSDTISVPGTIALPTFTTGSVIFAGAGGALAQDNDKLFFDATNFSLGIGNAAPGANTLSITQPVKTSGSPSAVLLTAGAHTGLATAEVNDVYLNLTRTVQITGTGGTLALERAVRVGQPTYAFTAAHTITNAATVAIEGAPAKGANATITNTHALLIQAGAVAGASYSYGLTVNAQTGGGTADYCAAFLGGLVGVGVAIPLNTLHVSGDLRVTGALGVYQGTAGEAFAQYEALYGDAAGGSGYFKKAVNTAESTSRVVGVAVTGAGGATAGFTYVTAGIYKMKFAGGYVPAVGDMGKPVYLSAVAGSVTLTAPVAAGSVVIRVGYLVGYGAADSEVGIHVGDTFVV